MEHPQEKAKKQWNIQNISAELDTEVRIYLAKNKNKKLFAFVIEAVEAYLKTKKD